VIAAHGTGAAPHHAEAARTLAATAPRAVLRVVDGEGHGIHRSNPAALAALVREALVLAA
jgi:pimeloyl-ACP methyl ester carboxylesterase